MTIFLIFSQLMRYPLTELFHLSGFLQMLNHRMVDIEFFGSFLCSYKRMNFDDPLNWSLLHACQLPMAGHCTPVFKALVSFANFLNHHCTVHLLAVPGSNALLMLRVISAALWPILNLNKKVA